MTGNITHTHGQIAAMILALLCPPTWAHAQAPGAAPTGGNPHQYRAQGYAFVAPGVYVGFSESVATMHVGGGGEGLVYKGLGLGAEVGALWATRGSDLLGMVSVDGSYHSSRGRKVSPFLTGGYSLIGGNGRRNLVNFGGGLNWWLGARRGIRLEFRDHVYADGGRQILDFRIAFAFR